MKILESLLNAQHKWGAAFSADHLVATGEPERADAAYARHVQCSTQDPTLQEAAAAMVRNNVSVAERKLKKYLMQKPTDVAAIRMLAEVAARCDRDDQAKILLQRCLELSPSFTAARYNYALLLQRGNDSPGALVEIERCLETEPSRPNYRNLCAVILGAVGEYERASEMYEQLLEEYPRNAKVWQSYRHVLKTQGRQEECIDAYRACIARDPAFGDAYWNSRCQVHERLELDALATQARKKKGANWAPFFVCELPF